MIVLSEQDVERLLTPAAARGAVEGSLERLARGEAANAVRQRVPLGDGVFAVMHAVDRGLGYAGLKSYVWRPGGTPFAVLLFALEPPRLAAVVEAERLGRLRTAAATAVAARRLARPGAATLGVFGCGRQAEAHVAALREVLPLERVCVHGRDPARTAAFCERLGCEATTAEEAGAQDVVVTATTASEPVLRGAWLRPGALVCGIGANDPAQRELDDEVFRRAALVVTDSLEEARAESGDLLQGGVDWSAVRALQDVHAREADDDVVVFKSNGMAAWDVAVAAAAVDAATR